MLGGKAPPQTMRIKAGPPCCPDGPCLRTDHPGARDPVWYMKLACMASAAPLRRKPQPPAQAVGAGTHAWALPSLPIRGGRGAGLRPRSARPGRPSSVPCHSAACGFPRCSSPSLNCSGATVSGNVAKSWKSGNCSSRHWPARPAGGGPARRRAGTARAGSGRGVLRRQSGGHEA